MKKKLNHARTGLETMHQGGGTKSRGSAALAGNTRKIFHQGSTPEHQAPVGQLQRIMGQ